MAVLHETSLPALKDENRLILNKNELKIPDLRFSGSLRKGLVILRIPSVNPQNTRIRTPFSLYYRSTIMPGVASSKTLV